MKKIIFISVIFCLFLSSYAQKDSLEMDMTISNINFSNIYRLISDTTSPYFYDNLIKKYHNHDEELGFLDYNYLYYGYTFQNNYNPYGRSEYEDDLHQIMQQKDLKKNDYKLTIKIAEKVLEDYPFHLDIIYYLYNWHEMLGNSQEAELWKRKFSLLSDVIFASGDGKNPESAFVVSSVNHEYVIISMLGLSLKNQSLITSTQGMCDYLEVKKNENNLDGVYFNIQRLFDKMSNSSYNF